MRTRVLLADDHAPVRAGLQAVLARCGDVEVVGEADDGRAAVRLAAELRPDVILMDLQMPELGGIDATRLILAADPKVKVIGLSMHCEGPMVLQMLEAGARGYVLKNHASAQLATAIRMVLDGERYLSPKVVVPGVGGQGEAGSQTSGDAPPTKPDV